MTVRHFDGVDDRITMEPLSPGFTGAGTFAALWRGSDGSNHGIASAESSGLQRWALSPVSGDEVYGEAGGFAALHTWSADEWYLTMWTKPSGTAQTVRAHSMPYSTGVWTHANRGTLNDSPSGSTAVYLGYAFNNNFWIEGEIAVIGVWSGVQLTDGQCESLESELINWVDLAPTALWALNQESTSDPVLDLSGNGFDQTAITGTSVLTGDDPPGFNFSLVTDTHFYRQSGAWVPTTRKVRQGGTWVDVP